MKLTPDLPRPSSFLGAPWVKLLAAMDLAYRELVLGGVASAKAENSILFWATDGTMKATNRIDQGRWTPPST